MYLSKESIIGLSLGNLLGGLLDLLIMCLIFLFQLVLVVLVQGILFLF